MSTSLINGFIQNPMQFMFIFISFTKWHEQLLIILTDAVKITLENTARMITPVDQMLIFVKTMEHVQL